jgi:lysozyme
MRATIGNYYTDPRFYVNWDAAREVDLLISAYHVVTPDRPPDSQITRLFDVLDGRRSDFPLVLDVELSRGVSRKDITACVEACIGLVEEEDGRPPIVYTARWFWDKHVLDSQTWPSYDLWVAHYGVHIPTLPADWDAWRFWQYSDHGRVPGIDVRTDVNWFNGSLDDLIAYAGVERVEEVPPAEGLQARVTTEKLTLRSGPGANYQRVGDLEEGEVVNVVSLGGEDIWIQVEPGKWAPFTSRHERYMELEQSNQKRPPTT